MTAICLFSLRHQSWVIKIDYQNGTGSGNVLWRLGYQGDFALAQGSDPSLWFSFQHFPSLISQNGAQTTIAIWAYVSIGVEDAEITVVLHHRRSAMLLPRGHLSG